MSENFVWADTHQENFIDEPFQAYIAPFSNRFADWLLGLSTDKDLDKRFGYVGKKNLVKDTLKVGKTINKAYKKGEIGFNLKKDSQIISKLEQKKNKIQQLTTQFYTDIGCSDFYDFSKIWAGQNNNFKNPQEEDKYWINKYLNLLTGQTQFIATGFNNTLIEQLLELTAISIQDEQYEGVPRDMITKIKEILYKKEGIIKISEYNLEKHNKNVFIPTKRQSNIKFIEECQKIFENYTKEAIDNEINENINIFVNSFNKIAERNIKYNKNKNKNLKNMFVNLNMTKTANKSKDSYNKRIIDKILEYMQKARIIKFTDSELQSYFKYDPGDQILESWITKLCLDFLKTDINNSFYSNLGNNTSVIMGFLGELYTHGKMLFNLSKNNFKIYNTGNLLNLSKEQLAYDSVIVINSHKYGIQTKNPYLTEDGEYETYKTEHKIDSPLLYSLYLEDDDDFKESFQLINLNVENTTNPSILKDTIEHFLYLYGDNFMRLGVQKIDGLSNMGDEIMNDLYGDIQNIFFVVRGEIIEAASFLEELINQYKYVLQETKNVQNILNITYINNTSKNYQANAPLKYNSSLINQNGSLNNIKIKTVMNITVPAMKNLKRFKI